jgi:translation initiation factor 5B
VIVGFNINIEEDAKEISKNIKIITEEVVYKLIERLVEFRKEKSAEIQRKRMMGLSTISKLEILHQYIFRNTNPAIFGVKIQAGKLKQGITLIDENGEKVGKIKSIQCDKNSVEEAKEDQEVCISIPGINFERTLKEKKFLYTELGESQFREFKKNKDLLTEKEKQALMELSTIKRKTKEDWGI